MSNKLDYEISKRYSHATMDGYLATNIKQLRTMIAELLDKIQNDEQGDMERMREMMNRLSPLKN